jgi:nitroreductase
MNIFEAIVERKSIRRFLDKDVDNNLIGILLYMATQAPSAGNMQDWKFIVVKDPKLKKLLADAALGQKHVEQAPVVIVVCGDLEKASLRYGERGEVLYVIQDTAAAIQNILLSATALGLAACWIGAFDEEQVKTDLQLPDKFRPLAMLPLGYADEKPEKTERVPYENLSWQNNYGAGYELIMASRTSKERDFLIAPLGQYLEGYFKKWIKKMRESREVREKERGKKKADLQEILEKLTK